MPNVTADEIVQALVRAKLLSSKKRNCAQEIIAALQARPAVPIDKSVTQDALICLEDGIPVKMLRRYLRAQHNLSPEQYRVKWGLPTDYPMVAPGYSAEKSAYAKHCGLGTEKLGRH